MLQPSNNLNFVRFVCRRETAVLDDFLLCKSQCENDLPKHVLHPQNYTTYPLGTVLIPEDEIIYYEELFSNSLEDFLSLFLKPSRKRIKLDGYSYSLFRYILNFSSVYRSLVAHNFLDKYSQAKRIVNVVVHLKTPSYHIIDYKWNFILSETCLERRELEVAMSWLSTLGGAFSSLGDNFEYCAVTAGNISAHQFKLALRMGDPLTVARCKLYFAISLIQRRKFRLASDIVRSQYALVHSLPVVDRRIVSMCLGIWSKLKYEKAMSKSRGH